MEGVLDPPLREVLTRVGDFDFCVSEFIRITDQHLPAKVFYRLCPELHHQSKTKSGTPVKVQLLGNNPETLARSANKAIKLGSHGIDLNFGCPAKTVNKHKGGAILMKEPSTIQKIIERVRSEVPNDFPVTAKMRLGWDCHKNALSTAKLIEEAGATELVIHARTKIQGYKPPAHWHLLKEISAALNIPVIANGDIWTLEDYITCKEVSGCSDVMIGRGAIASPYLCQQIRDYQTGKPTEKTEWKAIQPLLSEFYDSCHPDGTPRHDTRITGRLKQWLHMLGWQYPEAKDILQKVKRFKTRTEVFEVINRY
jgi:tRNA-dihydrouridine synthase C